MDANFKGKTSMNHYTIVMVGYNSVPWIQKSVESALSQEHPSFDVIAIDADTDDGTYDILKKYEGVDNFTLVRNDIRKHQTENIATGVQLSKPNSIVCTLDFDDWLSSPYVLSHLDTLYKNDDVWMTYGSYIDAFDDIVTSHRIKDRYDDDVVTTNSFRTAEWKATHLRTFRRELFLKINQEDFIDKDTGNMYTMAGDLSFMLPMLEMSGERFEVSPRPLYMYNRQNPLSDDKVCLADQERQANQIRGRTKYQRLDVL